MHEKYLEHYGVPGMKWGRRRGGNSSIPRLGPPVIELGPNDYRDRADSRRTGNRSNTSSGATNNNSSSNKQNGSNSRPSSGNSPGGKSTNSTKAKKPRDNYEPSNNNNQSSEPKKFDIKGTQSSLKEGKKLADAGAKYLENDRKKENAKNLKEEARNMTDDDLRKVINRLSMEEKYVAAMEKEGVGKSKTDLQKTLELVGTAVSYADTALDVYDKIQGIRGRR